MNLDTAILRLLADLQAEIVRLRGENEQFRQALDAAMQQQELPAESKPHST